jgi:hypothetical protein
VSSPDSQRTTGATSSGPACRSSSASAAIFALRAGVAATAAEASTSAASCTR